MPKVHLSPIGHSLYYATSTALMTGGRLETEKVGANLYPTYTDITGTVANPNPMPINVDSAPKALWLESGVSYIITLYNPAGGVVVSYPEIVGVGDSDVIQPTEWLSYTATAFTYLTSNTFQVTGDQRDTFTDNRRVRVTSTAIVRYGSVISTAYNGSLTVVTCLIDGALTFGLGITAVDYSFVNPKFSSLPAKRGRGNETKVWASVGCEATAALAYTVSGFDITVTWTAHPLIVGSVFWFGATTGPLVGGTYAKVTAVTANTFTFTQSSGAGAGTVVVEGWVVDGYGLIYARRLSVGLMHIVFSKSYSNTGYALIGAGAAQDGVRVMLIQGTAAGGASVNKLVTGCYAICTNGTAAIDCRNISLKIIGL